MSNFPSVLAISRGINLTNGAMFNMDEDGNKLGPVKVVRHGIRGVLGAKGAKTKASEKGSDGVAQIQMTETARTDENAHGLLVRFVMNPLSLHDAISGCNDAGYRSAFEDFINVAMNSESLAEVSRRYARNILNGRWLWRNRAIADRISIEASWGGSENERVLVEQPTRLADFNDYTEDEKALASVILQGFKGSAPSIEVIGRIYFDRQGSYEVHPSENYLSDKPKGLARLLYKYGSLSAADFIKAASADPAHYVDMVPTGLAALRDAKIGNAIRTIDTWYDPVAIDDVPPISVEPNGANIDSGKFLRAKGSNSYSLLETIEKQTKLLNADEKTALPDAMFLIATIVRGGVYGESKEKNKGKEQEQEEQEA